MTHDQASETRSARIFKLQHEPFRVMAADALRFALERLGSGTRCCPGAASALVLFKAGPDAYHAVITDQDTPGMTGPDLSRHQIAVRPSVPIELPAGSGIPLERGQK